MEVKWRAGVPRAAAARLFNFCPRSLKGGWRWEEQPACAGGWPLTFPGVACQAVTGIVGHAGVLQRLCPWAQMAAEPLKTTGSHCASLTHAASQPGAPPVVIY